LYIHIRRAPCLTFLYKLFVYPNLNFLEISMKLVTKFASTLALVAISQAAVAAPCLTNLSDSVGNSVFGATVGTFASLGVNPNTTCIENGLWSAPSGFALGSYIQGAGGYGAGINNAVLGSYGGYGGTVAQAANGLDFAWVQNTGNQTTFSGGAIGARPSKGIIWDLGGQANQAVVFPFVDHGPVPGEVLENSVWLSNDPNAADGGWIQATLNHVYGAGWSADPNVSDGFVAVYGLANNATFRYVSVTWGGPNAIVQDGDNEIDAVGGLTVAGCGVNDTRPECQGKVPEPGSLSLVGLAMLGLVLGAAKRRRHDV
jgi:hypothetical protein